MQYVIDDVTQQDVSEIHFLGLLANVNSKVLRLNLGRGFEVQALPEKDGVKILAELEHFEHLSAHFRSDITALGRSGEFYVVKNVFDSWVTTVGENDEGIDMDPENNDAMRVPFYLEPALQLVRFFTGKNICMPFEYYYTINHGRVALRRKIWHPCILEFEPNFSLNDDEISQVKRYLEQPMIPIRMPFLSLAFRHFEASFETAHKEQAFLSLMIALEIILQPIAGGSDLAKNVSTLLSSERDERREIFREVKELYYRRNALVHEGVLTIQKDKGMENLIGDEILFRARSYVRKVILKTYKLGKNKNQLSEIFHSST